MSSVPDSGMPTSGASSVDTSQVGVPQAAVPTPGVQRAPESMKDESIGTLLSGLTSDVSTLMRQEVALAKAELTIKAKEAGKGAGMLAGAAVFALAMLGALTALLIIVLDNAMPSWAAALIVTVLWALVAGILAQVGRNRLKQAGPLVPEQAIDSTKEDVQWAKTQLQSEKK